MKEWLTLIIIVLIVVIVLDGWRRMRSARYGKIRMSSRMKKRQAPYSDDSYAEEPEAPPSYTSELPNGGARVVGQRDPLSDIPSIEKKATAKSFIEKQQRKLVDSLRPAREPEQARLNLDESVPLLMEALSPQQAQGEAGLDRPQQYERHERIEPTISPTATADSSTLDEPVEDDRFEGEDGSTLGRAYEHELAYGRAQGRDLEDHNRDGQSVLSHAADELDDDGEEPRDEDGYREYDEYAEDEEYPDDEEDDLYDEERDADDYDADEDYEQEHDDELEYEDERGYDTAAQGQQPAKTQLQSEPEEVLIINIMAHRGELLPGGALLDALLKCGMRYGDMDIFHRYSDAKGEGALLFSMANMVKPGTFDLDAMDDFTTPGVSLFMTLPLNADSMQSFELMVDTAKYISQTLGGELKDEQRSVMTRQTIEHSRQRILDFERRRLFRRPR